MNSQLLELANSWAFSVWQRATENWINRAQDLNYTKYVKNSAVDGAIQNIAPKHDAIFVDVGCGEGFETHHLAETLAAQGNTGVLYGFDPQPSFIEAADARDAATLGVRTEFFRGQFDDFLKVHNLESKVSVATSLFVLQDTPYADEMLASIAKLLMPGGYGIFVFLHPKFVAAMDAKGVVHKQSQLNPEGVDVPWNFAAEYPIVEEDGRTFLVPIFDRSLDMYRTMMEKYFSSVELTDMQPSTDVVARAQTEKLSPFYNHEGNIYFPEIVEMPSAVLAVVRK